MKRRVRLDNVEKAHTSFCQDIRVTSSNALFQRETQKDVLRMDLLHLSILLLPFVYRISLTVVVD